MKTIIFITLMCAVGLNAQLLGLGFGRLGLGGMGGYANGGGYGGQGYRRGASSLGNLGYQNSGIGGFHNIGGHNNRASSINQVDNSEYHNVGGGSAGTNGGFAGNGFNRFQNGGSGFGNGFGTGYMGHGFLL